MAIQIRKLKVKDRKRVTQLFKKTMQELGDDALKSLISSDAPKTETETNEEQLGETIVKIALDVVAKAVDVIDVEMTAWFSDLISVTPEEFDELDMDAEAIIIGQLKEAPEAKAFFTLCFANAKLISALESPFRKLKDRFDSLVESELSETSETSPTEK